MKTQSKTPTIANVVTKHSISSELAQKMVDEAMVKARQLGVAENVAILDDGGNLKAFGRMDGAPILCIEMAQNKAYTALFGVISMQRIGAPSIRPDRKSTRLNSSHQIISYAVFCLKKKKKKNYNYIYHSCITM